MSSILAAVFSRFKAHLRISIVLFCLIVILFLGLGATHGDSVDTQGGLPAGEDDDVGAGAEAVELGLDVGQGGAVRGALTVLHAEAAAVLAGRADGHLQDRL